MRSNRGYPENMSKKVSSLYMLAERFSSLMKVSGKTISVAESCTGGLISSLITDVPGSSLYFKGSVIAYSNGIKSDILGVPEDIIDRYGAVSGETVLEMASGIRQIMSSDVGLAVTGIAGPGGGSQDKPVGLVYISLCDALKKVVREFKFKGSRDEIRSLTAERAFEILIEHLEV